MKCIKCLNSCFWSMSLKLGAYIICFIVLVTSIATSAIVAKKLTEQEQFISDTLKALMTIMAVGHGVLFFATCGLLYGLCMENKIPLLLFVPVSVIIAVDEFAVICYIIVNRGSLPDEAIRIAAGQTFILVFVIYSAVEVFSLYMQWQEDSLAGRRLSRAIE